MYTHPQGGNTCLLVRSLSIACFSLSACCVSQLELLNIDKTNTTSLGTNYIELKTKLRIATTQQLCLITPKWVLVASSLRARARPQIMHLYLFLPRCYPSSATCITSLQLSATMGGINTLISNGMCYYSSEEQSSNNIIPCRNVAHSVYSCCKAGDVCLEECVSYNVNRA